MRILLKLKKLNFAMYEIDSEKKARTIYERVKSVIDHVDNFYIYSNDLEIKIDPKYPLYKYFGGIKNQCVELEIKFFNEKKINEPKKQHQCYVEKDILYYYEKEPDYKQKIFLALLFVLLCSIVPMLGCRN